MQNNFYFLKQVSASLQNRITGFRILSCFSQTKNELILELEKDRELFYIRINTLPELCCISFPKTFARSKKNNVDLFPEIIDKRITNIVQFENDRSFALQFDNLSLAILLHGVRANVVLYDGEQPTVFFNKKLSRSFDTPLSRLHRFLDISFKAFQESEYSIKQLIPTFDKTIHHYLEINHFKTLSHEDQWIFIESLLEKLNAPVYYIVNLGGKIVLSLVEVGEVKQILEDPLLAANAYFEQFTYVNLFTKTRDDLLMEYQKSIIRTKSFLAKTTDKLRLINDNNDYEQYANILMANLHVVTPGAKSASLYNFYISKEVDIPLKEDLTPQKNAELYYKKAKNKKYEISNLESVIGGKQEFLKRLEEEYKDLQRVATLKELKIFTKRQETQKNDDVEEESYPFKRVLFDGFEILVGKNAKSNDELLQKYTHKDDLWLHAKDVTGSHVVLKYKSGNNFPAYVIERAAEIAAFNSKRKTDSYCPVTYTARKFVRKQKGLPPGAVIVEKEKVLIVTPKGY